MIPRDRAYSGQAGKSSRVSLPRLTAFFLVAAAVLVADQWSKAFMTAFLLHSGRRSVPVFTDYIRLTYTENRGAAFGLLQDQTSLFIVVGVVVIAVIAASYRYIHGTSPVLNVALGLQMGGALGNLLDRIRYGYVVDFIDLTVWPVFNVADSAIVVGVLLMALVLLTGNRSTDSGKLSQGGER